MFLSENAAAILPTIRSRCVELKLRGGEETEENGAMVDRAVELGTICARNGKMCWRRICALWKGAKLKRTDLTAFLSAAAELCTQALLCQYGRHPAKIYEEMAEKLAKSLTKEQLAGIIEILRSDLDESVQRGRGPYAGRAGGAAVCLSLRIGPRLKNGAANRY